MSPTDVMAACAAHLGVTLPRLLSHRNQGHAMVRARGVTSAVLRDSCGLSYPQIGRLVDRHHTTVMDGIRGVRGEPDACAKVLFLVAQIARADASPAGTRVGAGPQVGKGGNEENERAA